MFALERVSKEFVTAAGQRVAALAELSARGERGCFTCLLGATGCGKTTALRLLAGLERPSAGAVRLGGENPTRATRKPAYLEQQHTLLPWLRLEDNVAFPLRLRGVGRAERRAAAGELLARVGLAGRERLYPHECSGGMQQRAMLARTLATGADCWLLDEPFSSLDERTRFRLQEELLHLQRERGCSALFVTHNVEEAVFLADRIVVLTPNPGRAAGTVELDEPHPRDRLGESFARRLLEVRRLLETALLA